MMRLKKLMGLFIFYLRGGVKYARYMGVQVGNGCRIYTWDFGSEPFLVKIGNNVTITAGVTFITHDGSTWLFKNEKGRRYKFQPIEIGNNVFIGIKSILMPGVKIEDNVIVAAGSVVTKSIPSGVIVAGVPARIIGQYDALKEKALNTYFSDKDIQDKKVPYKERVSKLISPGVKPFLKQED